MKLPMLDLILEVPLVDVQALKLEFFAFMIVISYCFFMCLKRIKEIGGFRELYNTLREENPGCERED